MSDPLPIPPPAEPPPVDNLRGAKWMVISALCFATAAALVKRLGAEFAAPEIAFFRCLFGLFLIVPFVARQGLGVFRTTSPKVHIVRVLCAVIGINLSFYATTHLPLATATSLGFTRPLFMIILGMLVLGEVVRWRRGLATIVGFGGVVIMLGPADLGDTLPALAALGAAAFTATAIAAVRKQSAVDGAGTIMVWFGVGTAFLNAFPAAIVWRTPETPEQWALLASVGLFGSLGQYFMLRAFMYGEATAMNPIDYSQIIMTALLGYLWFGEIPSAWTWLGAAIIVGSTLYILIREQALTHGKV